MLASSGWARGRPWPLRSGTMDACRLARGWLASLPNGRLRLIRYKVTSAATVGRTQSITFQVRDSVKWVGSWLVSVIAGLTTVAVRS